MKKSQFISVIAALALVLFLSTAAVSANSMPGGWNKIATNDKMVSDSVSYLQANFPVIVIDKVQEAYQQVVAGLNVKIICTVAHLKNKEKWEIVIYKDLKGTFHLTSAKVH